MCTFNLTTEQARDMALALLEEEFPSVPPERLMILVPDFPEGSPEYVTYRNRLRASLVTWADEVGDETRNSYGP